MYPVAPIALGPNLPSQMMSELRKVGATPPVPNEHRLTEDWNPEAPLSSMKQIAALKGLRSLALPHNNVPFNVLEG